MKTLELSEMECAALRLALTKRLLNLRLDEMSFKRLDMSTTSIHSEILVVDLLLSKLS